MHLIAAVMKAPDHKTRFSEAATLLDYGFANCELYTDNHASFICTPVKISNSLIKEIEYYPEMEFSHISTTGEDSTQIKKEIALAIANAISNI